MARDWNAQCRVERQHGRQIKPKTAKNLRDHFSKLQERARQQTTLANKEETIRSAASIFNPLHRAQSRQDRQRAADEAEDPFQYHLAQADQPHETGSRGSKPILVPHEQAGTGRGGEIFRNETCQIDLQGDSTKERAREVVHRVALGNAAQSRKAAQEGAQASIMLTVPSSL